MAAGADHSVACLYREAPGRHRELAGGVGVVLGLGQAPQGFLFPLPVWEGEASRGEQELQYFMQEALLKHLQYTETSGDTTQLIECLLWHVQRPGA